MGRSRSPTSPHPAEKPSLKRPCAIKLNSKCSCCCLSFFFFFSSEQVPGSPGGQAAPEGGGEPAGTVCRGRRPASDHRPFTATQHSGPGRSAHEGPRGRGARSRVPARRRPRLPQVGGARCPALSRRGRRASRQDRSRGPRGSAAERRRARPAGVPAGRLRSSLRPGAQGPPNARAAGQPRPPPGAVKPRGRAGGRPAACAAARTSPHGHTRAGEGAGAEGT